MVRFRVVRRDTPTRLRREIVSEGVGEFMTAALVARERWLWLGATPREGSWSHTLRSASCRCRFV